MNILNNIELIDLAIYTNKALIFSDFHMGYEEALNKQGILVPRFQFEEIMQRLEKIFEKHEKVMRQAGLSKTMGLMEALDKYIGSKPELKDLADEMKSYAEKLIRDNSDKKD